MDFDAQADRYEARTGLPLAVGREVATLLTAGLLPGACVVDVGAGTGTIGRHVVESDVRYVAIDQSAAMLAELERALPAASAARATVIAMDANEHWPLDAGSVARVLFSRSLHLLDVARIVTEIGRVVLRGGRVLVGRVRKPEGSVAERLRQQMQQLLREHDVAGKNGQRVRRDFLDALVAGGAGRLPLWTSAAWTVDQSARQSLDAWRSKPGLGGRELPAPLKDKILDHLTAWAERELGDLDAVATVARTYEIEGVQLGQ